MIAYVALLRAVNVGGTGKLAMRDLVALCEQAGFAGARTYIASGNVVFASDRDAADVKAALEERLEAFAGKPIRLVIRTAAEMAAVRDGNPFPDAPRNTTLALFLNHAPPPDLIAGIRGRADEQIALGAREVYIAYGAGMARSRLRTPVDGVGTARNINTVARLAEMAAALQTN